MTRLIVFNRKHDELYYSIDRHDTISVVHCSKMTRIGLLNRCSQIFKLKKSEQTRRLMQSFEGISRILPHCLGRWTTKTVP